MMKKQSLKSEKASLKQELALGINANTTKTKVILTTDISEGWTTTFLLGKPWSLGIKGLKA